MTKDSDMTEENEKAYENYEDLLIDAHDSVREAITYLCSSNVKNFYARVLNTLEKLPVPGIKTMGVTQQRGRYILMYDPKFATQVSHEELVATVEHEVLHIIMGHLPRYMRLYKVFQTDEDRALFNMSSNIAADLADNELLALDTPGIKGFDTETKKGPIGYWVIPEEFDPVMPGKQGYENYHKMCMAYLRRNLNRPPSQLWQLVKQQLQKQKDAADQAMQEIRNANNSENEEGDSEGDQDGQSGQGNQDSKQGSGGGSQPGQDQNGQGQGQGNNQQGQGQPQNNNSTPDLKDLDPIEQKLLEMLMQAAQAHVGWEDAAENGSPADAGNLNKHGKEVIKNALDAHKKSRGTLPSQVEELIRAMLLPPVVPWPELLRQVVQNTRQKKPRRGMAKVNKKLAAMQTWLENAVEDGRLPEGINPAVPSRMSVFPGTSYDKKFTIVYAIDTSGSMSKKEIIRGFNELQHIQKSDPDVTITVMFCDADIGKEYTVSSTDELDYKVTGRGGTDFEPVFRRVRELLRKPDCQPDILIYATDGYAPAPRTKLPIPTVWLITPGGPVVTKDAGHITLEMKDKRLGDSTTYDTFDEDDY